MDSSLVEMVDAEQRNNGAKDFSIGETDTMGGFGANGGKRKAINVRVDGSSFRPFFVSFLIFESFC